MTPADIPRLRLRAQRIAGERCATPEAVVRWMGAMQAQDERQSLWAIGVRTAGATVADVRRAVAERAILRTWPMRGTIHVVPAEDAAWMLRLTAARHLARDGRRLAQLGLDERDMARGRDLFAAALAGGKRLTRAAMMAVLEAGGIASGGGRGYHALWHAAQSGLICFGPTDGAEQTFVLLDDWVPAPRRLDGEEALAELATRYFRARGPATVRDFAWWAGITLTEARAGLAGAGDRLAPREIDGVAFWMAADGLDGDPAAEPDDAVHLLPGFDEYLLGYRDRGAVLPAEHAQKIVPGNNGVFRPVFADGRGVVGTWKARVSPAGVAVSPSPFGVRASSPGRVAEAASRYARFLGLPLAAIDPVPAP
jgi:hypothetical protein